MKKKSLVLLITLILVFGLYSCGSSSKADTTTQTQTEEVKKDDEKKEEEKKEDTSADSKILVKLEELEFIKDPEELVRADGVKANRVYVKNNSKYPLRSMKIHYTAPENSNMIDPGFFKTLMPGAESTYFYVETTKGEPTAEYYNYVVYDGEKSYEINYNVKEDKYTQNVDRIIDMFKTPKDKVKVTADKIPFEYVTLPPDSFGIVYSDFTFQNHSEYPLISVSLYAFSPETRTEYIFGSFDTPVKPGDSLPDIKSFGAENLVPIEIQYTLKIDGKEYTYSYDYQLDLYVDHTM